MTEYTPAGLQGVYAALYTFEIPDYWSPEQALAVWELLNEIADRIWQRYEGPMVELIRTDLQHEDDENRYQPDLFDPDDTIPF
jgi:hypothetical protein